MNIHVRRLQPHIRTPAPLSILQLIYTMKFTQPQLLILRPACVYVIYVPSLNGLHVAPIPQLFPKQHKMETQYTTDSLLITLAGRAAT